MLRALIDKLESRLKQVGSVSWEVEILKKNQERNARDQKHSDKNEECLWQTF